MIRILTAENTTFSMNDVPSEVEDIRYCVLDYSNQENVDYYFMPLIFLESFSSPAALLRLGPYQLQVPLDWSIVIGEKHFGDIEIIGLMALNDRDFSAFCINPIDGYMPNFFDIEIINVFPDVKWFFPKLKFGHILAVPLRYQVTPPSQMGETTLRNQSGEIMADRKGPPCAFFVRDVNKLPDTLDIRKIF